MKGAGGEPLMMAYSVKRWLARFCLGVFVAAFAAGPLAAAEKDLTENVISSVVAISAIIPDDARTARTLGALRSGSGIVIGADGLVLTIGYLILEAEKAEVTDSKGDLVPVRVKIRSASFNNISIMPWLLKGVYVPDVVSILASLYFILGDIDR